MTFTELLRAVGKNSRIGSTKLADFLKSNQVANRMFLLSHNHSYGIILAAENQRAQETFKQFPTGATNPS
ncbi:MAG: hypothetical protein UT84_C0046G0002 [Candidatus Curtissbacteria bacterium GW2011_GWA1_40_16]|uniref:Uncharacterized protein n=1 Tax=Candidatus Curtissbacteria bacterium GW2011_GWA1_40_16 TaxID=1618405 RepID=A0A0G0R606_9BACT|nr:MAG: hypothetical protein UT84_C0046G0002 [Candidatus Curtissbacteria bacterium GW2011_GWA1_40_16]